jgi:hypothetical protein
MNQEGRGVETDPVTKKILATMTFIKGNAFISDEDFVGLCAEMDSLTGPAGHRVAVELAAKAAQLHGVLGEQCAKGLSQLLELVARIVSRPRAHDLFRAAGLRDPRLAAITGANASPLPVTPNPHAPSLLDLRMQKR